MIASAFGWFQAIWVPMCLLIIVSSYIWRFDHWIKQRTRRELPWDEHPLYGSGIERRHRNG